MIELLIKACAISTHLTAAEGECRDFSLLFDAHEMNIMTCMIQAQPIMAQWKETHQKWEIEHWSCGMNSENISSI